MLKFAQIYFRLKIAKIQHLINFFFFTARINWFVSAKIITKSKHVISRTAIKSVNDKKGKSCLYLPDSNGQYVCKNYHKYKEQQKQK